MADSAAMLSHAHIRASQPRLRRTADAAADPAPELKDGAAGPGSTTGHTSGPLPIPNPPWHAAPHIYTGYRPVRASIRHCLSSLFTLHNETVNIYTHLVPAVLALTLFLYLPSWLATTFPRATRADALAFGIYAATTATCFAVSSAYHTLLCHSEGYSELWVRIDYVAILLQILGSFISGLYLAFYCEPHLQWLYWGMIAALVTVNATIVINPGLQSPKWRLFRTASFVVTGLSAFVPIVHAAVIFPYGQLDKQAGLRYYYLEGVLVLLGALHFATNFPESWKPGRFDFFGSSHQIFHVLVVLSSAVHLCGIVSAFRWNYENPRCPVLL